MSITPEQQSALLEGVRVVELSVLLYGDMVGAMLGDLGADIVKVEAPPYGDSGREAYGIGDPRLRLGSMHLMVNRNKRSIGLNLKSEEGYEIFSDLIRGADVVIDLSVPGTRMRIGADYDSCRAIKPDIIYASISPYGYEGPYTRLAAHGMGPMAFTGGMSFDDRLDGSVSFENEGSTAVSSASFASMGILAALTRRDRTGEGCWLESTISDAPIYWEYLRVFDLMNPRWPARLPPTGERNARYAAYRCRDGKVVMFMPDEDKFWRAFCDLVDRPDLVELGAERDSQSLRAALVDLFATRDSEDWIQQVGDAGVPINPAQSLEEFLENDGYVSERGVLVDYLDPRIDDRIIMPSLPVREMGTRHQVRIPAPDVGAHNAQILGELGFDQDKVAELTQAGVVFDQTAANPIHS